MVGVWEMGGGWLLAGACAACWGNWKWAQSSSSDGANWCEQVRFSVIKILAGTFQGTAYSDKIQERTTEAKSQIQIPNPRQLTSVPPPSPLSRLPDLAQ
jgi:hypothetical protein